MRVCVASDARCVEVQPFNVLGESGETAPDEQIKGEDLICFVSCNFSLKKEKKKLS